MSKVVKNSVSLKQTQATITNQSISTAAGAAATTTTTTTAVTKKTTSSIVSINVNNNKQAISSLSLQNQAKKKRMALENITNGTAASNLGTTVATGTSAAGGVNKEVTKKYRFGATLAVPATSKKNDFAIPKKTSSKYNHLY